jgi:methylenetetrahydrofolate reductase (NADPH)
MGMTRIVALRGDLPSGYGGGSSTGGEFRHASDLVAFIRAETGDDFHIEVAAYPETHPQAKHPQADLQAYLAKVQAGASSAITQFFYNADAYFRFVDDAARLGASIPVVPGIMPITNSSGIMRFADGCGAEIPRWIRLRLTAYGEDVDSIKAFGLDVVTDLCERLRAAGVPALHFYTMNQSATVLEICRRLGG